MKHDTNYEAELLKQTELKWNNAIQENLVEEMGKYMDDEWISWPFKQCLPANRP